MHTAENSFCKQSLTEGLSFRMFCFAVVQSNFQADLVLSEHVKYFVVVISTQKGTNTFGHLNTSEIASPLHVRKSVEGVLLLLFCDR